MVADNMAWLQRPCCKRQIVAIQRNREFGKPSFRIVPEVRLDSTPAGTQS
jgi:hypothetical protein